MTNWIYPDSFNTMTIVANWVAAVSTICCVYLLASWAALPVDKTNRHYLSVCLTLGVMLMNVGLCVYSRYRGLVFDILTPSPSLDLSSRWPLSLSSATTPLRLTACRPAKCVAHLELFCFSEAGAVSCGLSCDHYRCIFKFAGKSWWDEAS